MTAAKKLLSTQTGGDKLYVDDVFSTYLYTGNGSVQTINNGIDLAGEGGLVWIKKRINTGSSDGHWLVDSIKPGAYGGFGLQTNTTDAQQASGGINFTSAGFSFPFARSEINGNGNSHVSWTFRNAPKFFKCATVVKTAGSNATVDLSSLGTIGMVTVKRTDSTGDWYTWHRSLPAGQLMYLNQTAAAATMGHITVSGTTLTLVNGVIADGTYVVYAWAHDPSEDGLIQCGSFTQSSAADVPVIIGREPQFLMVKRTDSTAGWMMFDDMRGFVAWTSGVSSQRVFANTSDAEANQFYGKNATGFVHPSNFYASGTQTYIYVAVPRPNKPPKTGEEVYNAIARTGTSAKVSVTGTGFPPDLLIGKMRGTGGGNSSDFRDRLRGATRGLLSCETNGEKTPSSSVLSLDQDGFTVDIDNDYVTSGGNGFNTSTATYINYFFRRAPGFFDVVCYTGTGVARTVPHNLGVAPELIIHKSRNSSGSMWCVYSSPLGATNSLYLHDNSTAQSSPAWNRTAPTDSVFTVGTFSTHVNGSGSSYVAYLFASLPGISKVGSYTGNGTSLSVECGFSTGARFILVKSIDDAGDWYVWDSARGVVAANDPHLSLNTTAAEVTTDDSVDPYAGGFIANQNTATNININGKRYIFLAIA